MLPHFYSEGDLIPLSSGLQRPDVSPAVAVWLRALTRGELHRQISSEVRGMGFDWMTYGTVAWRDGVATTTRVFKGHSNLAWAALYFGDAFHQFDPRLSAALCSTLPVVWDADDARSWPAATVANMPSVRSPDFPSVLRHCGIGSGMLIALPENLCTTERTVVGLASSKRDRSWIDDDVVGAAMLFALSMMEFMSNHVRSTDAGITHAFFSPTRREILWHLTQGQSNKQIAYRLGMSADTVKYHLRELRRQFNAQNRMGLVRAAQGAVVPGHPQQSNGSDLADSGVIVTAPR